MQYVSEHHFIRDLLTLYRFREDDYDSSDSLPIDSERWGK